MNGYQCELEFEIEEYFLVSVSLQFMLMFLAHQFRLCNLLYM